MTFVLHPKLAADSAFVCDLPLSQVRLSNNAAFPWLILVPRQKELTEIIDLAVPLQQQLWQEITLASKILRELFQPTKLNVANLGNVVSQLHIHVIARFNTDSSWPHPVWNSQIEASYSIAEQQQRIAQLAALFQG